MRSGEKPWRNLSLAERQVLANDFGQAIKDRLEFGADTYGEDLVGDPLWNAMEEIQDAGIYLFWAIRQRDDLLRNLHDANSDWYGNQPEST